MRECPVRPARAPIRATCASTLRRGGRCCRLRGFACRAFGFLPGSEKPNDAMKRFQPPANVFTVASLPPTDQTAILRHVAQGVLRFFELHEQLSEIVVAVGKVRI